MQHYTHTQHSRIWWLPLGVGVAMLVAAGLLASGNSPVAIVFVLAAGSLVVLSLGFQSLTIREADDRLELRYGPLPLFRKRIPFAAIDRAERDRTRLIHGWGIHWVPGDGWTYNLGGFDCAKLYLGNRTIRIGTDDPEGLVEFLQRRIGGTHTP